MRNLRQVASAAGLEDLQRGIAVMTMVVMLQTWVLLIGVLDLAGRPADLDGSLERFDGAMVRRVQADPMWPEASKYRLPAGAKQRVRQLVLAALGLLIAGRLQVWEDYRDRLLRLVGDDRGRDKTPEAHTLP